MTTNEIAKLAKVLKGFYMGEVIPFASAIRGYYDGEAWECGDCTRMYADHHACVECEVEYVGEVQYSGEMLAAHVTHYVQGGKFVRSIEYWRLEDVKKFVLWA